MSNEIIQSVAYDNYDDFQLVNSIFSKKFVSLVLRVRYRHVYVHTRKRLTKRKR
jgi:hypothetical protein